MLGKRKFGYESVAKGCMKESALYEQARFYFKCINLCTCYLHNFILYKYTNREIQKRQINGQRHHRYVEANDYIFYNN